MARNLAAEIAVAGIVIDAVAVIAVAAGEIAGSAGLREIEPAIGAVAAVASPDIGSAVIAVVVIGRAAARRAIDWRRIAHRGITLARVILAGITGLAGSISTATSQQHGRHQHDRQPQPPTAPEAGRTHFHASSPHHTAGRSDT